jgi:tetratricopeptide (TPR) repeat protein
MKRLLLACLLLTGCAPLAVQHRADAAFRHGLTAHIRGDEESAARFYREIVALGFDWSAVWNNLAVITAHQHEYRASRKLLARAIAADPANVVALTNYGVMSYHLADLKEAERVLVDAMKVRKDTLDRIPSGGRFDWEHHVFNKRTAQVQATAERYLERIAKAEITRVSPVLDGQVAAIPLFKF